MARKLSNAALIRAYLKKNPDAKPQDVAIKLNVKPTNVYLERSKMKKADEKWKTISVHTTVDPYAAAVRTMQKAAELGAPFTATLTADPVNQPPHYKTGGIETIDFIEAKGLNYRLGNVVKYITRAEHKGNRKEDLQKALWYLQREIEKV